MWHVLLFLCLSGGTSDPSSNEPPPPPPPPTPTRSIAAPFEIPSSQLDTVVLRDGGMLRGTISDLEPDRSVTVVVLGSNEVRVVPWSLVDHVELANSPVVLTSPQRNSEPKSNQIQNQDPSQLRPPTEGTPSPPSPLLTPNPLLPGTVMLHIDSPNPAVELRKVIFSHGRTDFDLVCRVPCDAEVDGHNGETFYFGGPGIPDSDQFRLLSGTGRVKAKVTPGSDSLRLSGWIMIGTAPVLVGSGLPPLVIGLDQQSQVRTGITHTAAPDTGLQTAGIALMAVGGAALVAGIVMLVESGTDYQLSP